MQSNGSGNCDSRRGAISPSRLCFDDAFIVENSDLFRETIIARERLRTQLDRIIARRIRLVSPKREEKKPAAVPPPLPLPARVEKARREPSTPTASLPKQLVRKPLLSPLDPSTPRQLPSSAPDNDGAFEEPGEEGMETTDDLPQSQKRCPSCQKPRIPPFFVSPKGD
ncbi:hypothetical protein TNCV_993911 [Trichonephila clavipes]|nr:hypothetical protein TNCV_993911 [Trichonephila clavipes]